MERTRERLRKFGPKKAEMIGSATCAACKKPFKAGDHTTLIPLGPGDDPVEQDRAKAGRAYNAVAVEVHWDCAGVNEEEG